MANRCLKKKKKPSENIIPNPLVGYSNGPNASWVCYSPGDLCHNHETFRLERFATLQSFDDLLIASNSWEEHLVYLEGVLATLEEFLTSTYVCVCACKCVCVCADCATTRKVIPFTLSFFIPLFISKSITPAENVLLYLLFSVTLLFIFLF